MGAFSDQPERSLKDSACCSSGLSAVISSWEGSSTPSGTCTASVAPPVSSPAVSSAACVPSPADGPSITCTPLASAVTGSSPAPAGDAASAGCSAGSCGCSCAFTSAVDS
eukprot:scaffold5892_cov112-Isochrysis_galbana.AAC.9